MVGTPSVGKMSLGISRSVITAPKMRAIVATTTVKGRRIAGRTRFMGLGQPYSVPGQVKTNFSQESETICLPSKDVAPSFLRDLRRSTGLFEDLVAGRR